MLCASLSCIFFVSLCAMPPESLLQAVGIDGAVLLRYRLQMRHMIGACHSIHTCEVTAFVLDKQAANAADQCQQSGLEYAMHWLTQGRLVEHPHCLVSAQLYAHLNFVASCVYRMVGCVISLTPIP